MILSIWAVLGLLYYVVQKPRKVHRNDFSGTWCNDTVDGVTSDSKANSECLRAEAEDELRAAEKDYAQLLFAEAADLEEEYLRLQIGENRNKVYKRWQQRRRAAWEAQLKYVKKWED